MNTIDKVRNIRISDYNYPLPDHRIAKHPLAAREQCKLLCYKVGGEISEGHFYDVPAMLPEKAMLVYNNTRVINARLRFRKSTGSTIEIFCLEPVAPCDYQLIFQTTQSCTWLCLVGNSKRWKQGPLTQEIEVDGKTVTLEANRGERRGNSFEIEFSWNGGVTFASILEAIGEIPTSTVAPRAPTLPTIKPCIAISMAAWRHQRQDFTSPMRCWQNATSVASHAVNSPCMWVLAHSNQ